MVYEDDKLVSATTTEINGRMGIEPIGSKLPDLFFLFSLIFPNSVTAQLF